MCRVAQAFRRGAARVQSSDRRRSKESKVNERLIIALALLEVEHREGLTLWTRPGLAELYSMIDSDMYMYALIV